MRFLQLLLGLKKKEKKRNGSHKELSACICTAAIERRGLVGCAGGWAGQEEVHAQPNAICLEVFTCDAATASWPEAIRSRERQRGATYLHILLRRFYRRCGTFKKFKIRGEKNTVWKYCTCFNCLVFFRTLKVKRKTVPGFTLVTRLKTPFSQGGLEAPPTWLAPTPCNWDFLAPRFPPTRQPCIGKLPLPRGTIQSLQAVAYSQSGRQPWE